MNLKNFNKIFENDIVEFETKVGFRLPADYREFLLQYNGGTPIKRYSTFWVSELEEEIPLDTLFGLRNEDEALDLSEINEEFGDDLLERTVIIGDDPGDGLLVLIDNTNDCGVYYWDHSYFFESSSDEKNIYFVAESFKAFLETLKNPE